MRTLAAVMLLALPISSLSAQVRETIEVNLLEIDAVVVDRNGRTVRNLTADDFDVQVGSKRAAVTNFFAVEHGIVVEPAQAAASSAASETSIPTSLLILIDDTRLSQRSKVRAIAALKDYVRANVGPSTSAMLARWNGSLDVRTRPTDRPGPLLAELDKMASEATFFLDTDRRMILREISEVFNGLGDPGRSSRVEPVYQLVTMYAEREALAIETTLDALKEVVRVASAFDGRRSVLYLSDGLPLIAAAEIFDYWDKCTRAVTNDAVANLQESGRRWGAQTIDRKRFDRSEHYHRVIRAAQKANVSLFAVDAAGARGYAGRGIEETGGLAELNSLLVTTNLQDGVRYIANETGGRFISNENDLASALAVVSEQFRDYYSLGVRAPSSTRMMKVRVAVKNRPELRVITSRHRRPLTREEELERSVRSRLYLQRAENPLGAEVSLGSPRPRGAQCVVPVQVSAATADESMFDLYLALLDERQQESGVQTANLVAERGRVAHSLALGVREGKYVLSLALANRASGETTYLQREIDARNCR